MSLQCMANVLCKGCGQKGHVRKDCTGESSSQHHSDKGIMSSTNKEMCDSSLNQAHPLLLVLSLVLVLIQEDIGVV